MTKRHYSSLYLLALPIIVATASLIVFPLIYVGTLSLSSTRAGMSNLEYVGLSNFIYLFQSSYFWTIAVNTGLFVLGTVALPFALGLIIATLITSIKSGKTVFRVLLILPLAIMPVVAGLTWNMMLNPLYGVVNHMLNLIGIPGLAWASDSSSALITVVLIETWQWTPFMFIIIYAGMQMLPGEPFEAALIDGASRWQRFIYITLPLLKSSIVVALIIRVLDSFKAFDIIYTVTRGGPGRSTEIFNIAAYLQSFKYYRLEQGSAIGITIFLICLIWSVVFMRITHFRQ